MITRGTILIERNAARPPCFQVEAGSYPDAWMSVQHNLTVHEFERELTVTGWTFFDMANAVRTMAFGFDRARMIHTALTRLIRRVNLQKCNCVEIDDVIARSFLWVPYISILAHARHIQRGNVFAGQES